MLGQSKPSAPKDLLFRILEPLRAPQGLLCRCLDQAKGAALAARLSALPGEWGERVGCLAVGSHLRLEGLAYC